MLGRSQTPICAVQASDDKRARAAISSVVELRKCRAWQCTGVLVHDVLTIFSRRSRTVRLTKDGVGKLRLPEVICLLVCTLYRELLSKAGELRYVAHTETKAFKVITFSAYGRSSSHTNRSHQMNVVYYVDTPPPTVVQSKFTSNSSFQDSAAVEAQYARLIRDSSVARASAVPQPGPRLVSGMTAVHAPALPVVQPTQWPAAQLHATYCNTTQLQYLVRSLSIIIYYSNIAEPGSAVQYRWYY